MHDRYAQILESKGTHRYRLVERSRLHGVAIVQHDLATGCLEGLQVLLGWLAARDPAWHRLSGVGKSGEGVEE